MDAATDILGRNYAKGKEFDRLFAELKEGAGTRYNPYIVRLIEDGSGRIGQRDHSYLIFLVERHTIEEG